MTDNTKYEVTQADIEAAAVHWCGDKERETFPEDIDYFKRNWRALPGLRKYVEKSARHRLTSQPDQSNLMEAVAWRFRRIDGDEPGPWKYTGEAEPNLNPTYKFERQSLYTAPQPDRERVLRDAAEDVRINILWAERHYSGAEFGTIAWPEVKAAVDNLLALLTHPTTDTQSGEYICKCGVRVEPHRCAPTDGGF